MNFQGRQSTVRTHSELWTFIASKVTEIIQRTAILTSFCQSQVLDMKCNWQDERISDKFRDCQERQWNKCQTSAYCSTALPSVPREFPEAAIPLAQALLTTACLVQSCAAIVKHRKYKIPQKNQASKCLFKIGPKHIKLCLPSEFLLLLKKTGITFTKWITGL